MVQWYMSYDFGLLRNVSTLICLVISCRNFQLLRRWLMFRNPYMVSGVEVELSGWSVHRSVTRSKKFAGYNKNRVCRIVDYIPNTLIIHTHFTGVWRCLLLWHDRSLRVSLNRQMDGWDVMCINLPVRCQWRLNTELKRPLVQIETICLNLLSPTVFSETANVSFWPLIDCRRNVIINGLKVISQPISGFQCIEYWVQFTRCPRTKVTHRRQYLITSTLVLNNIRTLRTALAYQSAIGLPDLLIRKTQ